MEYTRRYSSPNSNVHSAILLERTTLLQAQLVAALSRTALEERASNSKEFLAFVAATGPGHTPRTGNAKPQHYPGFSSPESDLQSIRGPESFSSVESSLSSPSASQALASSQDSAAFQGNGQTQLMHSAEYHAPLTESTDSGPSTPSAPSASVARNRSTTPPHRLSQGQYKLPVLRHAPAPKSNKASNSRTHAEDACNAAATAPKNDTQNARGPLATSSTTRTDSTGTSFHSTVPCASMRQSTPEHAQHTVAAESTLAVTQRMAGMHVRGTNPPEVLPPPPLAAIITSSSSDRNERPFPAQHTQHAPSAQRHSAQPQCAVPAPSQPPLHNQRESPHQIKKSLIPDTNSLQQLNPADLHRALAALVDSSRNADMHAAHANVRHDGYGHRNAFESVPEHSISRLSTANLLREVNRQRQMPERPALPASPRTSSQRLLGRFSNNPQTSQHGAKHALSQWKAKVFTDTVAASSQARLKIFLEASVQSVKPVADMQDCVSQKNACMYGMHEQVFKSAGVGSQIHSATPSTPNCEATTACAALAPVATLLDPREKQNQHTGSGFKSERSIENTADTTNPPVRSNRGHKRTPKENHSQTPDNPSRHPLPPPISNTVDPIHRTHTAAPHAGLNSTACPQAVSDHHSSSYEDSGSFNSAEMQFSRSPDLQSPGVSSSGPCGYYHAMHGTGNNDQVHEMPHTAPEAPSAGNIDLVVVARSALQAQLNAEATWRAVETEQDRSRGLEAEIAELNRELKAIRKVCSSLPRQ